MKRLTQDSDRIIILIDRLVSHKKKSQMPKIVDKKQKRVQILEAAISTFARKGMAKTKMSDIAEAAGIGKGTIYEYFSSKEDIFYDAFDHFMHKAEHIVFKRLKEITDPLEKLRMLFDAWKTLFLSDFKDTMEIMLDFWAEGIRRKDEKAVFSLQKIYDENRQMIKDILDECVSQKKIRPVDTNIAASVIMGAMDGEMVQWITDPHLFAVEESLDLLADIILNGLIKRENTK